MKRWFAETVRGSSAALRRAATAAAAAGRALALAARRAAGSERTTRLLAFARRRGRAFGRAALHGLRVLLVVLRVACIGAVLAFLALEGLAFFTHRVPAGAIGVRQRQWAGGLEARDYRTGLHFSIGLWHAWHHLPSGTELALFGTGDADAAPALELRTREGNEVAISAVVPFRIRDGEGHALVAEGLRSTYASLARATIEDVLRQDLAQLTSEELVQTEARLGRVDAALTRLSGALAPLHVEPLSIQVQQLAFGRQYETLLQKKQLSRQLALLAEAGRNVEEEMLRNMEEKEGEAAVARLRGELDKEIEELRRTKRLETSRILADTASYDADRRAEARTEHERLLATADLELYRAESEKTRLTQAAYDSPGGRIDLARRAAETLQIERVTLNLEDIGMPAGLDLDKLVELLVGATR